MYCKVPVISVRSTLLPCYAKSMKKPSVLIVEDNENIRTLYQAAFEAIDIDVYTAENGEEGVQLALKHRPSVILMDIMMPGMNGHEAMEKIRLDRRYGRTAKVVYLTNMSDAENVAYAVEHGSDDYIVKANTDVKEVVNKVRTVMHG